MNETWWVDPSQLDPDQTAILIEPPESGMLIIGPPGSGKTNILILRANYVRAVGPRLLFLTFTRTLAEFLRSGPNLGRADQLQPAEVTTFMAWGRRTIRDHGGVVSETRGDFDVERQDVISELNRLIGLGRIGVLYDVAFIDEVQDFLAAELEIVRRVSERLNAAGDSRQEIFKHFEGLPAVSAMVDKTVELETHYRVGANICELADQILPPAPGAKSLSDGCNYPEEVRESSVEVIRGSSAAATYEACVERIRAQRRYITDEPIGVLCVRGDMRDQFWAVLSADPELGPMAIMQSSNEYQAFGPNSLIRVMTVASAKGSEFRAVHLLGAEEFGTNRRELAFTAVTRAKTELALYHVDPLPGHMTPRNTTLPSLASIF